MDFVGDFGFIEDGEEGMLRVFKGFGEVVKFFFYEEISSFLREVDVDYGGVSMVSGIESVV